MITTIMAPSNLPKDYEPKPRKPFNPKPFEPTGLKPPLDYDEFDSDKIYNGMGHNFWMGVCHGIAILIVVGVCSFAVYQLGLAALHILTRN